MKKEVEELEIYKEYLNFIFYIEMITEKYPKCSKDGLVASIKTNLYDGLKDIIEAYRVFPKNDKLMYLNKLDVELKMLKVFARVSYKKKYINIKNYEAWSRKINNVGRYLGGWLNSCLKQ